MIGNFKPAPAKMVGPTVVKPAPPKGEVPVAEVGMKIDANWYFDRIEWIKREIKERRL